MVVLKEELKSANRIRVLEDEMEGHVYSIVHRPVGSVGETQGVQEWVHDGCKVGLHHPRYQGEGL